MSVTLMNLRPVVVLHLYKGRCDHEDRRFIADLSRSFAATISAAGVTRARLVQGPVEDGPVFARISAGVWEEDGETILEICRGREWLPGEGANLSPLVGIAHIGLWVKGIFIR